MIEMKKQGFDIAALVDDLEPVKPLDWRRGLIAPAMMLIVAIPAILYLKGMRADLVAGAPHPMFLLRSGILILLGGVCGSTLLSMANPGVGRQGAGWKIAVAAALLFPLAALIAMAGGEPMDTLGYTSSGMQCLGFSLLTGMATAVPMVLWLRRGAPVAPERAGWLTGLAAGALGALAYGFHCPYNSIVYIGFWYSLAVGVCAIAGRLVVPKLIRW
jgi:hypothetical protein